MDDDESEIDIAASAQQVGLIETGGGLQHGPIVAVVAIAVAIVIAPIVRALRAWFRQ